MAEGDGQGQAAEAGQQQQGAPFYSAGSAEDQQIARLEAIVDRHPEMVEPETAVQAVATANHIASQLGDETLANEPALLELAHIANRDAAHAAQSQQVDQAPQGDSFDRALASKQGAASLPWH